MSESGSGTDDVKTTHPGWWTGLDTKAVDTARLLAADAVQKVGNGHPGTLTDSTWSAVPIQLVPGLHGGFGFFPGPDRSFVRNGSTAGTALPAGLSADGRSFALSWVSNASATSGQ